MLFNTLGGEGEDFGGSHGFQGKQKGINRRQRSTKGEYRKLTANFLPRRGEITAYHGPVGRSGEFHRDTTKFEDPSVKVGK